MGFKFYGVFKSFKGCLGGLELKYTFPHALELPPSGGDIFASLCDHYSCVLLHLLSYSTYFHEYRSIPIFFILISIKRVPAVVREDRISLGVY